MGPRADLDKVAKRENLLLPETKPRSSVHTLVIILTELSRVEDTRTEQRISMAKPVRKWPLGDLRDGEMVLRQMRC
jgi:hypothetical protein